jgi:hypothetical protein
VEKNPQGLRDELESMKEPPQPRLTPHARETGGDCRGSAQVPVDDGGDEADKHPQPLRCWLR